jgi:hypothetical protein
MAVSVLPANIAIQHQVWVWEVDGQGNPVLDGDGNPQGSLAAPVTRYIIGIQQLHDGRVDPISIEYVERTITDLILEVPDPTLYKKLDRVLVDTTGEQAAYEVQGRPVNWRIGLPWQHYANLFGGTVHVRRVN